MHNPRKLFIRRRNRNRSKLALSAKGRHRLSVHRSSKNIYAQIIDDKKGITLAAASTLEKDIKASIASGATIAAATVVGEAVATRAIEKGIARVVFDRGGFIYHGRIRALAEAARNGGLEF